VGEIRSRFRKASRFVRQTKPARQRTNMRKGTRRIPLSRGLFAIVDAIDYDWAMQWKWCAMRGKYTYYAMRGIHRSVNNNHFHKGFLMHRGIAKRAKLKKSRLYDHRDGNGLNDTRSNLRPCSFSMSNGNTRKRKFCTSSSKGVCYDKSRKRWIGYISINHKTKFLGRFKTEREAARAYAKEAKIIFGEFARLK